MNRQKMNTKELIARTAMELFVEKGVTETRIRDIASAAGIAEGTMYRHYASKDELAWELFSTNLEAFGLELDRVQKEHSTPRAKLDAMIHHFCRAFDEDWVLFSYLLLSRHGHSKKVTPDMVNPVDVLRRTIADGMEGGDIPKGDPDVATSMVLGLILHVADSRADGGIEQSLLSLSETLSAASWRVLSG
ncbi:TetR/AcrR family transcriptional regulator [Nitrospinae bacterium AH_259_B05_G02_I21]|nr:TetR/AcrR family transcriptional regulator [Nitrospinae bacterium AH_259_B05_G02_I21]MDA2932100.1 TetR/AcrR family transcriptional regulator [Nitrospinae bacterium AH-259-F20]